MKRYAALFIATLLVLPLHAYAYIDPGTGATLVSGIIPLVAAFFVSAGALFTKIFWTPIKGVFAKIRDRF